MVLRFIYRADRPLLVECGRGQQLIPLMRTLATRYSSLVSSSAQAFSLLERFRDKVNECYR